MEEIKKQVSRARRRLILQQFATIFAWTLFTCLLIAAAAIAVPKIWPIARLDEVAWFWAWLGGSVGMAFLVAGVSTYFVRRSALDAAMEIDRRFGLKERVASTLSLHPEEINSEAGHALVADAVRRVGNIDVPERFGFKFNWRAFLPLVPAAVVFALVFVPNAQLAPQATASAHTHDHDHVKNAAEALKKRVVEQRKKAEAESGLKDAADMFKKFEEAVDDLAKTNKPEKKQAMIKLNDLAKELEKRKEQLGGAEEMRDKMKGLKNISQGPADKIAQAMKEGNFNKALDEVKSLQEKLQKDELTEAEKKELAEQMAQMEKKLQDMAEAHEQAKQELAERIKQAQKAGDQAAAGKMQQQMDKLKQADKQMGQMQDMAQKLAQAKQAMQEGDIQQAAGKLGEMAKDMQDMQAELAQLETLDEMLDEIADAKDSMNCENCNGKGCEKCMGMGMGLDGMMAEMPPGMGLGEGQGKGERPEERTDTSTYDSQVRDKPKPGEAVRVGDADGPNVAGASHVEDSAPLTFSLAEDADPLADQRLPRAQREHAKEYFEALRDGKPK